MEHAADFLRRPRFIFQSPCEHDDLITSVAYSSDGRRILTGSADQTVRIWDAETHPQIAILAGHGGTVTNIAPRSAPLVALSQLRLTTRLRVFGTPIRVSRSRCFRGMEKRQGMLHLAPIVDFSRQMITWFEFGTLPLMNRSVSFETASKRRNCPPKAKVTRSKSCRVRN